MYEVRVEKLVTGMMFGIEDATHGLLANLVRSLEHSRKSSDRANNAGVAQVRTRVTIYNTSLCLPLLLHQSSSQNPHAKLRTVIRYSALLKEWYSDATSNGPH